MSLEKFAPPKANSKRQNVDLVLEGENLPGKTFTLDKMLGTGVNCFVESLKVAF